MFRYGSIHGFVAGERGVAGTAGMAGIASMTGIGALGNGGRRRPLIETSRWGRVGYL